MNVISIRGDDCSMENLGAMADLTSGHVDIVDPLGINLYIYIRAMMLI